MSIFNTKKNALKESLRRNAPQIKKRRKSGNAESQWLSFAFLSKRRKETLPKAGLDLSFGESLIRFPCAK